MTAIDERSYKPDLELLDRYQAFSAELLRVALLAIGLFGFSVKELHAPAGMSGWWLGLALLAFGFLAVAAGCALGHRYYSTDGMFHHIRYERRCAGELARRTEPLARSPATAARERQQGVSKPAVRALRHSPL
jgi:hypothetical protein